MKIFAKLGMAFFMFYAAAAGTTAQNLPTHQAAEQIVSNPKYTERGQAYSVEKIEYRQDQMIVHFFYKEVYRYITIYPIGHESAWRIEDENGNKYNPLEIRNLRAEDGTYRHKAPIKEEQDIDLGGSEKIFRCEIVFPRLPETVKHFDLVEGMRERENYFHVLGLEHTPKTKSLETVAAPKQLEALAIPQQLASQAKPTQRNPNPDYTVEAVEYHADATVFKFSFQDDEYPSGYFYGPQGEYAWILKDQDGNIYKSKAVLNIRANGELKAQSLDDMQVLSELVPKRYDIANKFTCDIVFDKLPQSAEVVDLIEGIGKEEIDYHFNVLQIALQLPTPIQPEIAATEAAPALVEPIAVEPAPATSNEELLTQTVAPACDELCKPGQSTENYLLYPNPSQGQFFIRNNGVAQNQALVQVYDLKGQLLMSQTSQLESRASVAFKLEEAPAGQYLVRIIHEDKTQQTLPLVIVK